MLEIRQLKERRSILDSLMAGIEQEINSAEMKKAFNAGAMCKAWLGRCLACLGADSPYFVVDKRKDIPPTADTAYAPTFNSKDPLERVNWLIDLYEEQAIWLHNVIDNFPENGGPGWEFKLCIKQAYKYAREAKMWMGFELQNMRREELAKQS